MTEPYRDVDTLTELIRSIERARKALRQLRDVDQSTLKGPRPGSAFPDTDDDTRGT